MGLSFHAVLNHTVRKLLVEISCIVIIAPIVATATIATLSLITVIFLPYFLTVTILAKTFRPDLLQPVFGDSVTFTSDEVPEKSAANLAHLSYLDGVISTDLACSLFKQRVVQKKDEQTGKLMFYRYRHTWTRFLGYNFWQPEEKFRAADHVREYDLEGELELSWPRHEKDVLRKLGALTARPWVAGKSPWELLVIQDYRTEHEPEKPRTALFLRQHHGLIDGYGMASLMRELYACPYTMPAINHEVSTLGKILSYLRIPYDISKELVSSLVVHPRRFSAWPSPSSSLKMGPLEVALSEPIKVDDIKKIKNGMGVSFFAVDFALLVGAYRRMMMEENMEIPREIPVILPLPKPNHPGGTNVHTTVVRMAVPVNANDPQERVMEIHKAFQTFFTSSWPLIYNWLVTFTGLLPVPLQAKLVFEPVLKSGPLCFSSFPGSKDLVQLEGKELTEAISCIGSSAATGPTVLSSGVNGKQRVVVTVNTASWNLKNFHKLKYYVKDELNLLLDSIEVDKKVKRQ